MNNVKIVDKMPTFRGSVNIVMDDAVREAARDTLVKAKERAPLQKGGLRSQTEVNKRSQAKYRVSFFAEYARYQEFGGDDKRTVRNYTTPGTGAHYLKNAGDEMIDKLIGIFRKNGRRARP